MFFLMSCERTSNVSEGRHIGTSDTDYIFEYTIDGHDYIKNERMISLTWGQLEAIKYLIKSLEYKD